MPLFISPSQSVFGKSLAKPLAKALEKPLLTCQKVLLFTVETIPYTSFYYYSFRIWPTKFADGPQ